MFVFVKIVAGLVAARLFTVEADRHYHGVCPTDKKLKRTGTLTGNGKPRCPDHNVTTEQGEKPEELDDVFMHAAGEDVALSYPGGEPIPDDQRPEGEHEVPVPPGGAAPPPEPAPTFGAYETQLRTVVREEFRAELDERERAIEGQQVSADVVVDFVRSADAADLEQVDEAVSQRLEEITASDEQKVAAREQAAATERDAAPVNPQSDATAPYDQGAGVVPPATQDTAGTEADSAPPGTGEGAPTPPGSTTEHTATTSESENIAGAATTIRREDNR